MVTFAKMILGRISTPRVVGLTLLVVYLPYIWLFLLEWNWPLMRIWPFLPGVAIGALIPPSFPHSSLPQGPDAGFLLTAMLLGISIFGMLRLKRAFWPMMAALLLLSCALSCIVYAVIKA